MPFRIEIKSKRGLTGPGIVKFRALVEEYYPEATISEKADRCFVATFISETNPADELIELKTSKLIHSASIGLD